MGDLIKMKEKLKKKHNNVDKKVNKLSDLAGSWEISEKEAENLKNNLR